jgi:hypothetical protein
LVRGDAPPKAIGNRLRSVLNGSLAGALAVTPGLVRIDLAHAFEQFLRTRLIDFGGAWPFTSTAAAWRDGSIFLSLVRHMTRYNIIPSAHLHAATSHVGVQNSKLKVAGIHQERRGAWKALGLIVSGGASSPQSGPPIICSDSCEPLIYCGLTGFDWSDWV